MLADQQNISVGPRPSYLPGQMNTEADALSRSKEAEEWMLAPGVARKIFTIYGLPLASERSKQLTRYFSTDRRDPHSLGTDALHHSCSFQNKLLYASPPPPQPDSIGCGPNSPHKVTDDIDHPLVAEGTMATGINQIIGPIALPLAGIAGHDIEPDNQQGADRLPQVEHGMAHLGSALRDGGVEPDVAGFIQNAWKPGTKAQYTAVWRQWTAWCGRQGLNAATPSAVNLLNYLWYLYSERQLALRTLTLGVLRSAVATLLQP